MSAQQRAVAEFDSRGAVLLTSPMTSRDCAAAAAAIARATPQVGSNKRVVRTLEALVEEAGGIDPALVNIIQHPWWEETAKAFLRAKRVSFFRSAVLSVYPMGCAKEPLRLHADQQFTPQQFLGSPRQAEISLWTFLSDVPEGRAPMLFSPGSHLALARHWAKQPELVGVMPRIAGVSAPNLPHLDQIPPLVPLVARAGQVAVVSTGMVHTASPNRDSAARRVMTVTFTALGTRVGLPLEQEEAKRIIDASLWHAMSPDRRHLLVPMCGGSRARPSL
jgi:hypothetical protein